MYALKDPRERSRRRLGLNLPHVARLTQFVDQIRAREKLTDDIPYFDPADGGENARVLFLLKSPGPGAVESGFISHDNPDPSAKNFLELLEEAGIDRADTVAWNLVPWALSDRNGNVRPVTPADEEDALPYLERLFKLLPRLSAVVLMGLDAQGARKTVQKLTRARLFDTYLTSGRVLNSDSDRRDKILSELRRVALYIQGVEHSNVVRPNS